ncbi:MAG: NADH-quinone oxidoreductase subunit M [Spirochaetes bacterium]|nr:NADH-quinone oxidoreductase subunit M [Spirochaetota bacterium]
MHSLILVVFPLLAGLAVLFLKEAPARRLAVVTVALEALFAIVLAALFGRGDTVHYALDLPWVPAWGISFRLGLDGISLVLVLLTVLVTPVALLLAARNPATRTPVFYALVLAVETGLLGVFAARDAIVFYLFWELALVPVYFIAAIWGGEKRVAVTLKFFIYTVVGSLLMLFGILYVYFYTLLPHSFSLEAFYTASLPGDAAIWLFACFFAAFAVKMPVFPFHTWQSDTYHEAPAAGTVLLAALMAKMGAYGAMRWLLPVLPDGMHAWQWVVLALSLIGVVWGSIIALTQKDMKRLLAWSSFAHTGLIAAGIFSLSFAGLQGAVVQMAAHGIAIAALFLVVDIVETRTGSRAIGQVGGLAHRAPLLAVVFMFALLSAIGLPLTAGFVGEFQLLYGVAQQGLAWALPGLVGVVLGAVYMLQWFRKTMLGDAPAGSPAFAPTGVETTVLVSSAALLVFFGVWPKWLMDWSGPAVDALVQLVAWK